MATSPVSGTRTRAGIRSCTTVNYYISNVERSVLGIEKEPVKATSGECIGNTRLMASKAWYRSGGTLAKGKCKSACHAGILAGLIRDKGEVL